MVARVHKEVMSKLREHKISEDKIQKIYDIYIEDKMIFDKKKVCLVHFFSKKSSLDCIKDLTIDEKVDFFIELMHDAKISYYINKIKKRIVNSNKINVSTVLLERILVDFMSDLGAENVYKKLKKELKYISRLNDSDDLIVEINKILLPRNIEKFKDEIKKHNMSYENNIKLIHVKDEIYMIKINQIGSELFQKLASPIYCTQTNYQNLENELFNETSFIWCIDFAKKGRFNQLVVRIDWDEERRFVLYDYYNKMYSFNLNLEDLIEPKEKEHEKHSIDAAHMLNEIIPKELRKDERKLFELFKHEYPKNTEYDANLKISSSEYVDFFNILIRYYIFKDTDFLDVYKVIPIEKRKSLLMKTTDILTNLVFHTRFTKKDSEFIYDVLKEMNETERFHFLYELFMDLIKYPVSVLAQVEKNLSENMLNIIFSDEIMNKGSLISGGFLKRFKLKLVFNRLTEQDVNNLKKGGINVYLFKQVLMEQVDEKYVLRGLNIIEKEDLINIFSTDCSNSNFSFLFKRTESLLKENKIKQDLYDAIILSKDKMKTPRRKNKYREYKKELCFHVKNINKLPEFSFDEFHESPNLFSDESRDPNQLDLFEVYGYFEKDS